MCALPAAAQRFVVASEAWEPFFIEQDGDFTGIGVDILREVLARTGDSFVIKSMPLRRGNTLLKSGAVDIILLDSPSWSDPEFAGSYLFSDPVLVVGEYAYTLSSYQPAATTADALAGKVVSLRTGYRYPAFERYFDDGSVTRHEVDSDEVLLRLLVTGRADAIFMDSVAFEYTARKHQIDVSAVQRGLELSQAPVAIKLAVAHQAALERINAALADIRQDGTLEQILSRYRLE